MLIHRPAFLSRRISVPTLITFIRRFYLTQNSLISSTECTNHMDSTAAFIFVIGTTNRLAINRYNIAFGDFMAIFHPLRETPLKLYCRNYIHHSSYGVMNRYTLSQNHNTGVAIRGYLRQNLQYLPPPSSPAITAVTITKMISVSKCSTFQAWRGSLITEIWFKRVNPFMVMARLL